MPRQLARQPSSVPARRDPAADLGRAAELAAASDSPNTRRAYKADVAAWQSYAESTGLRLFPIAPDALAAYIGAMDGDGLAVSTIRRRCSALARLHREQAADSPTDDARVRRVIRGLARLRGTAPKRKRAATAGIIRAALVDGETSPRDRALLAVGFVTGLRRGELAALSWDDVEQHAAGLVVTVRRSKTDQAGAGSLVAVPYTDDKSTCPARMLLAWRRECGGKRATGRVFDVCDRTIARVVQRAAVLAGEDAADFGAHSLRAGLATTVAEAGVTLAESMAATRHRSADIAATYVRPTAALKNRAHRAAADALGSTCANSARRRA